jgi:hypothetical protein
MCGEQSPEGIAGLVDLASLEPDNVGSPRDYGLFPRGDWSSYSYPSGQAPSSSLCI